ncbi:hypothetical protein [Streptomyces malaysiensis]
MTVPLYLCFMVAGQGRRPDPSEVLQRGHALAPGVGLTIEDGAEPVIRQSADGSDAYRVEIPAHY